MDNNAFHHICILTNSYEKSLDFYMNILHFSLVKESKNFHNREYNTWLESCGMYIELQTPKNNNFQKYNKESEGVTHICFYNWDLDLLVKNMKLSNFNNFKLKNNKIIYKVEGSRLFKIFAPEGTIIEFRESMFL